MDALQGLGGMQGFSGLQSLIGSINPQASEKPSGALPQNIGSIAQKVGSMPGAIEQGLGGMGGIAQFLSSPAAKGIELPAGMPGGLASALSSPAAIMQIQAVAPIVNQFLKPITDAQAAMQKTLAALQKTTSSLQKTSTASQEVIKQMSGQVTQILQASQPTGTETEAENSTQTAGGGRRKQSRRFIPRKARKTRRQRRR